ncbi:MAG: DNRLRE domain-containing protein, partial [Eubacterium sp.]|nr:DNRLRE domain-containing protein [Eubacterium sp.]
MILSLIIAFGTFVAITVGSSRLQNLLRIKSILSAYAAEIVDTKGAVGIEEDAMLADNHIINLENRDGSNTMYLFSEPISYTDENGELKTKDISVEKQNDSKLKSAGYEYTNGQNDYRINFSSDIQKGVMIEFNDCGYSIIPQTDYTSSVGKKSTSVYLNDRFEIFEYSGAFGAQTVLKFYPQLNGLKDEIVLNQNINKNTFSFALKTDNCKAVLNDDGTVSLISNEDESSVVQTFSKPFAYDSEYVEGDRDEHYTDCTYTLEQLDDYTYIMSVTVDKSWLDSEATVYPVTIDPTTSNLANYKDAGIYSSATSRVIPYGNEATCCFGRTSNSEFGYGRVLNYFSWPEEIKKGAKINSAYIWERETTGRTSTTYVAPCLVKDHWVESSVTWENRPDYYPATTMARKNINSKSTDKSGDPYWYKFDITSAVQYWTDGTYHNYGLLFRSSEEDDGNYNWRAFASKQHSTSSYRPYTVINYTNDTVAPTINSVTGNPTAWTNGNVTLTINGAADNSGGSGLHSTPYSFSTTKGSYAWQSGNTKTFSSNCTVYIYVRDAMGNIRLVSTQTINKIDKTAPSVPTVTGNATEWTSGSVTLTANSTDSQSGIAAYSFSTVKGSYSWQTGKTKTVAENTTLYVYSKDNAGNISQPMVVDINKIDKNAPEIPTVTGNTDSWTNNNIVLTAQADDDLSGVAAYSFSYESDQHNWQTDNTFEADKQSKIYVCAKDNAGNISDVCELDLKIDKLSPTGSISAQNPTDWVRNVTITADASDEISGLHEMPYSFSSSEDSYNWQASNQKVITINGTYY